MINLKPAVYSALLANSELITLLGGEHIHQQIAPDVSVYPRITFFELVNTDTIYVDDTADASEIHMQIDIWSKSSTSAIAQQVDITMKSIGFKRESSPDLFEDDTRVFHKAMQFSIVKIIEEV